MNYLDQYMGCFYLSLFIVFKETYILCKKGNLFSLSALQTVQQGIKTIYIHTILISLAIATAKRIVDT